MITNRESSINVSIKRKLALATGVGLLVVTQGCSSNEQDSNQVERQPQTTSKPLDKCINVKGAQEQIPNGLVRSKLYNRECVTPREQAQDIDDRQRYNDRQYRILDRLAREQNQREQQLRDTIIDLPKSARSMAVAGVYCTAAIGNELQGIDGSSDDYSGRFILGIYEKYRDQGPSQLPAEPYDFALQFCPETLPQG